MSTFQSEKVIPVMAANLGDVARAVETHFLQKGFEVTSAETIGNTWHISIHQGGLFKAVLGMKTALNITIQTVRNGTLVNAGIGVFGQQVVPALITWFIFWPVLITQIWGLVQQSKLDAEAISCVEQALAAKGKPCAAPDEQGAGVAAAFCKNCGKPMGASMKFCPACGTTV